MSSLKFPRVVYDQFSRIQWEQFRSDEPLTLTESDVQKLKCKSDEVSLQEVEQIYLPLSRLLSQDVRASQDLHQATAQFLNQSTPKVPYIIGVAGSVAVGKSTTSRVLKALLSRWPSHPRVEIITTDGFLFPKAVLEKENLMSRKGFPESYDVASLVSVLQQIKSGEKKVSVPVYSHHHYDIMLGEKQVIENLDIIILEGLNILQMPMVNNVETATYVSDFLDFSLYVDAETNLIKKWFLDRVLQFWKGPFQQKDSYFNYLTKMNQEEVVKFSEKVWREINEENLYQNILPYKYRAKLILHKGNDHLVDQVFLRKL